VLLMPAVALVVNNSRFPDVLMGPLLVKDTAGSADAIVVLAAGVTAACTPNMNAVRRTLLGARLYHEKRAPIVFISGGLPEGLGCPVAEVMADLARVAGVPADRIQVENTSRTTWENARFSAPHLRRIQAQRLLLVTDRLHMARSRASFAHFGFDIERVSVPVYDGHRDNMDMLGIWYYQLAGRIGSAWPAEPEASGAVINADQTEDTETPMQSSSQNPAGPIAILGASYAEGWKVASLEGVPVVNKGITGQQSFELLARFETDIIPARPRAVILWGFINDIFRSQRDRVGRTLEETKASYTRLIAAARAAGIEPILVTELTMRQPNTLSSNLQSFVGGLLGKASYQDYVNGHVLEINKWLRKVAQDERLLLLDFEPVLSDGSHRRRKTFAVDDGSHVNEAGYAALTDYAAQVLQGRFK
jgi:uncharacterized SAM-binding protein YcdF (DUF218 family)/lysophospholipase L1-like esterase